MAKEDRVMMVFTSSCSPYTGGERASFTPTEAATLFKKGVAVYENEKMNNAGKKKEPEADASDEQNDEHGVSAEGAETKSKKSKTGKTKKRSTTKRKRVKIDD